MKVGVVGHGVVGSAVARFFLQHPKRKVTIYDKFKSPYDSVEQRQAINSCDLVFICVPTPVAADGESCDVAAVDECLAWITPPICIRSTVIPGTVDRLARKTGKAISFSPEYLGEQPSHPWQEELACSFLIVGGPSAICHLVFSAYVGFPGPEPIFIKTTARTAELCKYMENSFLATKVAFVNQFYDIAKAFDVDFDELRELWLADPRIGSSHSIVTDQRGFRGRCLPKDVAAIVAAMRTSGGAPLLEAVLNYNKLLCDRADSEVTIANDALGPRKRHSAFQID
jgi:UDPglucose 6-dehydrogenase